MSNYSIQDVEFLRIDGVPLMARLYKPKGEGPFRCIVELHGGVWTLNDRTHTEAAHSAFANAGIAVIALDFRQGAQGAYPLSVADAHLGIRWAKTNAGLVNSQADLVGLCGQSSGGHIASLIAIRPFDQRYASIPLSSGVQSMDAKVHCVGMFWPVVNPAGRYRHAKKLAGESDPPEWVGRHLPMHDIYWKSEENMEEGSPLRAIERGEGQPLPPALIIQPKVDQLHIYQDPGSIEQGTDLEKYVAAYRKAGGNINVLYYDAPPYFTSEHPNSDAARDAFGKLVDFFRSHIPEPKR